MSFRDVRDLTEQLKILGFTENIPLAVLNTNYGSLEAFKAYSTILQWLITRLEPGSGYLLPKTIATENDRVAFIRSVAEFLVIKAGIKINPKKLYASSAGTAKEILKITSVLVNTTPDQTIKDEEEIRSLQDIDLSDKIDDLRKARELSSELTRRGATLYDLLEKEQINKDLRSTQASRPLDLSTVERSLRSAINTLESKLNSTKTYLENSKVEKNNLNSKLQRKLAELDRSKQRLQALQKVRPAYLEEFERLEQELKGLYEQYIIRVRCVDALKSQLATRTTIFDNGGHDSPIAKVTDGSMTILPEGLIDSDDEDDEEEVMTNDVENHHEHETIMNQKPANREELLHRARSSTRLRARTGVAIRGGDSSRIIGSMTGGSNGGVGINNNGGEIDNLDSSLGSDDTESELDLNGVGDGLGSNLGHLHSDDEDDDTSMEKLTRDTTTATNRNIKANEMSDEDF